MRITSRDQINHFDLSEYSGLGFDPARAERVVKFIECLKVPSGTSAGEFMHLRPWQKRFIYDVYAPCDPETRRRLVRRAILSIARKNGKSALIAALVLVHLIGPESEVNGEIYSAATTREQAGQVFKFVAQMIRLDPELDAAQGGMLRVVDSTKTVSCPRNGSFYKALAAEANSAHGQSASMVIYDELAQAKNRELYDVLNTSMGAREEPLFISISTQSRDPLHILSQLIDDGLNSDDPTTVCHLYEVPLDTVDIYDENVWYLANPALGDFRSLDDLRALAESAKRMPSNEPTFRNLFINQRVSSESSLIGREEWESCAASGPVLELGEKVYAALDLSSVNDLTALILVSAEDGDRVMPFLWKPVEVLEEHSDRDFGKGNLRYVEWVKDGYLETTTGKTLNYGEIAKRIAGICGQYEVIGFAYDRWRIDMLLREFDRIDFKVTKEKEGEGLRIIPWGQGFKEMAPAVDQFERAVLDRRLVHPSNPVLTWNIANAIAVSDPTGGRKLDKKKARWRIDGAVALCMALGLKYRDIETGECGPSVYEQEERGFLLF